MIRVIFTAARDLTGLHEEGDSVELLFSASDLRPGRRATKDEQRSLAGNRETLLHNAKRAWSVTTGPLELESLDAVIEFLSSCEGGEQFAFEPWRYESGPSLDLDFVTPRLRMAEAVQCVLDGSDYSLERLVGHGTGGADDVYTVSFQVVEA